MLTLQINIEDLITDLFSDNWTLKIRALSKAITFIENNPLRAKDLLDACRHKQSLDSAADYCHPAVKPRGDTSHIIGITGFPGAGKSTIVNLMVKQFRAKNKTVAVLAVDPSSTITGGAVLGDRIRMQEHFKDDGVFIRSMGSRGALGGLAEATRDAIELIKLLHFDVIIIETVGIGQSESAIVQIADTVILILLPNTGDEIQFMKAGVIQLAHIYVINKTDLSDPYRMVHELDDNPPHQNGWKPPIVCTSAVNLEGIDELIKQIERHKKFI